MVLAGNWLCGPIAAGIVCLGSRFGWGPAAASADFGIADSPPASPGFKACCP